LKIGAVFHGGIVGVEVPRLTEGQGHALSGHKPKQAYARYAKQTLERALPGDSEAVRASACERRENKVSEYRAEFVSE